MFKIKDLLITILPGAQPQVVPLDCGFGPSGGGCDFCSGICSNGPTGGPCGFTCVQGSCNGCSAACTYVCTYACTAACTFICTFACTYACTNACTYVCTYACTGACTYACTAACTYACTGDCTVACTGYCTNYCTAACSVCSGVTGGGCGATCLCSGGVSCHCTAGRTANQRDLIISTQHLAVLRQQLERALAQVAANERVFEQQMQPQTLTDVELLEQKLTQALDELRAKKADLQKQSAGSEPKPEPPNNQ